ncbi:MAG: glycosyltransferase [Syntrophomonadaceae bacterium]|nr:glycosyltransferase [Syntrophomonadaceae bacterium]
MQQRTSDYRILMITPFHKNSRGNKLTSERLQTGLCRRGWNIELISLESANWQEILYKNLREERYSLIHGLNITHFTRVLSVFPDITHFPLLLTTTGTDVNYDLVLNREPAIAQTLNAVDYMVIFTDYFRTIFEELYPENLGKLVTIPQGVLLEKGDGPDRSQLGLHADDFVFLLPSGIRPVKNLELAIDALEKLQPEFPHLRLLILGTIIDKEYSDRILKRINALPWVIYPGEFPHRQMYSLLSMGDVVLNTSHAEGQPQAALEAMSLGKPCLLTAVPGNINIIENGVEGYYVQNQDALAAAARKLMLNQELRRQMGENARRLVEQKYSLEKELDAYEQLYRQLLQIDADYADLP